jgi:hypothetical protein
VTFTPDGPVEGQLPRRRKGFAVLRRASETTFTHRGAWFYAAWFYGGPMNEDTIAYTAIKPRLRPGRHGALPEGMPPDSSDGTPAHKATPASPCTIMALELDAPGTTSGLSGDACVAVVDTSPRGPDFVSERLQRAKSSNMLRRISESGDDMSRRVNADAGTTRRQEHEQNLPQLAV